MPFRSGAVEIKGPREIEAMREVSRMAGETLLAVADLVRPGITTDEINTFVHADTLKRGARPAPLNYKGFPKSVCTSVNEVVCHGIPSDRVLRDGDILSFGEVQYWFLLTKTLHDKLKTLSGSTKLGSRSG